MEDKCQKQGMLHCNVVPCGTLLERGERGGGKRRGASMSLLAEFSYLMLYTTFHAFFN